MSTPKERAYRYDLLIAPDWRARFDRLVDAHVELPGEGRILDVNCGTGAHSLAIAERTGAKGAVIGLDPDDEKIVIARSKAQVMNLGNVTFDTGSAIDLPFDFDCFQAVLGDASLAEQCQVQEILAEMIRVAVPEGRVALSLTTRGSFDEFFSIYWEALLSAGLIEVNWNGLEDLIRERLTVNDIERVASDLGLQEVTSLTRKEDFRYETAGDFVQSPLINDFLASGWTSWLPEESRADLIRRIISIIDDERHGGPFDVSVKATVISGIKRD